MKNLFKKPLFYLSVFLVLAAGLMVFNFAKAVFQEPTLPFPDGEVEAPIDESSTNQTKVGDLTVEGGLYPNTIYLEASPTDSTLIPKSYWSQVGEQGDASFDTVAVTGTSTFGGPVGIGILTPSYDLDVTGDINFTGTLYQNGTEFVSGGGGDNSWVQSGGNLYASSTSWNVGIGTNSPSSKLSVLGNIALLRPVGATISGGPGPSLALESPSSAGVSTSRDNWVGCGSTVGSCSSSDNTPAKSNSAQYQCVASDSGNSYHDVAQLEGGGDYFESNINCVAGVTSNSIRTNDGNLEFLNNQGQVNLAIDQSGNVNIGTTGSAILLNVKNQLFVRDGNYVEVKPGGSTYGLIIRDYNSSTNWANIDANDGYLAIGYRNSDGPLFINDDDQVGIGTAAVSGIRLNVSGNIAATGNVTATSFYADSIGVGTTGPSATVQIDSDDSELLRVRDASDNTKFLVKNNGGVSIGTYDTTPPDNGLRVYGEIEGTGGMDLDGNLIVDNGHIRIQDNPGTGTTPSYYIYQGVTGSTGKQYALAVNDSLWVKKNVFIDGDLTLGGHTLGSWSSDLASGLSLSLGSTYGVKHYTHGAAASDGFAVVTVNGTGSSYSGGAFGSTANPGSTSYTLRQTVSINSSGGIGSASFVMPVRKGDNWAVTYAGTGTFQSHIFWMPLGS